MERLALPVVDYSIITERLCPHPQDLLTDCYLCVTCLVIEFNKHVLVADPGFPRGVPTTQGMRQLIICQFFCQKLHENERNLIGGGHPWHTSLGSATVYCACYGMYCHVTFCHIMSCHAMSCKTIQTLDLQ